MAAAEDRYNFRIKKEVLNSGEEIYTPLAQNKKKFLLVSDVWQRISYVEGVFMLLDLPFTPKLTEQDCLERIEEFKKTLKEETESDIKDVIYIAV